MYHMSKTDFAQKNANRKAHKNAPDRGTALDARRKRRLLGGAFGNEEAERFNELAYGTTAPKRDAG